MARIDVRATEDLYDLIAKEANRRKCSMGEVLTSTFADKVGRPELGAVDKEKPGPKPTLRREKQPA